jgi:hypothetical protein
MVFNGAALRHALGYVIQRKFVLRELGAQFGVRDTRGVLLMAELAHSDLAEMIGSSRPMVSRLIDEMTKEGLVLRQRKQYVLLKSLAESTSDSPRQRNQFPGLKSSVATPVVGSAERSLLKNSVAAKGGRSSVDPAGVVANGSLKGL